MSIIDFSQPILGPKGEPIGESGTTLGFVAALALNTHKGQQPLSLSDAVARGTLALRVGACGEEDMSPEELVMIRGCLSSVWPPIVVARAAAMLG